MAYTIPQLKRFSKVDLIQAVMNLQKMYDDQANSINFLEKENEYLNEKAKYSCTENEYQLLLALRIFMANEKDEIMKIMQNVSMSCNKYTDDIVENHNESWHYSRSEEE